MDESHRLFITLILAVLMKESNGAAVEINRKTELIYRQHGYDRNPFLNPNSRFVGYDESERLLTSRMSTRSIDNGKNDVGYPYEEIRKYLKANQFLRGYFDNQQPVIIGSRVGSAEETAEGEGLCRIRQYKLIYPKRLKNVYNVTRTIINIEGEYEQAVEVKECASGGQCPRMESLEFGYTSQCTQEYMVKKLMVYNSSTSFDVFRFPSCCVCKIKQTKD